MSENDVEQRHAQIRHRQRGDGIEPGRSHGEIHDHAGDKPCSKHGYGGCVQRQQDNENGVNQRREAGAQRQLVEEEYLQQHRGRKQQYVFTRTVHRSSVINLVLGLLLELHGLTEADVVHEHYIVQFRDIHGKAYHRVIIGFAAVEFETLDGTDRHVGREIV